MVYDRSRYPFFHAWRVLGAWRREPGLGRLWATEAEVRRTACKQRRWTSVAESSETVKRVARWRRSLESLDRSASPPRDKRSPSRPQKFDPIRVQTTHENGQGIASLHIRARRVRMLKSRGPRLSNQTPPEPAGGQAVAGSNPVALTFFIAGTACRWRAS